MKKNRKSTVLICFALSLCLCHTLVVPAAGDSSGSPFQIQEIEGASVPSFDISELTETVADTGEDQGSGTAQGAGSTGEGEAQTDGIGDWVLTEQVDAFGDPTGKEVLSTTAVNAEFSNTATSGAELTAVMFYVPDDERFSFRLLEYGDSKATFSKSDLIQMMYKAGEKTEEAHLYGQVPDSDLYFGLYLDFKDVINDKMEAILASAENMGGYDRMLAHLREEDSLRFVIYIGSSKYSFEISTDGFEELLKKRADELYDSGDYDQAVPFYAALDDEEKETECRYSSSSRYENADLVRAESIITQRIKPIRILSPDKVTGIDEAEGMEQVVYCYDTRAVLMMNEYAEYLKDIGLVPANEVKNSLYTGTEFKNEYGDTVVSLLASEDEFDTVYGEYYILYVCVWPVSTEDLAEKKEMSETTYADASEKMDQGDYEGAFYDFLEILDYKDSKEKAAEALNGFGKWLKSGNGYKILIPSDWDVTVSIDDSGLMNFISQKEEKKSAAGLVVSDMAVSVSTEQAYEQYKDTTWKNASLTSVNNIPVIRNTDNTSRNVSLGWAEPEKGLYFTAAVASQMYSFSALGDIILGTLSAETAEDCTVFYDNPNCSVTVLDVAGEDPAQGLKVEILLENRTEKELLFSIQECWINGTSQNPSWGVSVQPKQKAVETIEWKGVSLQAAKIDEIKDIQFNFTVQDAMNSAGTPLHQDMLYLSP